MSRKKYKFRFDADGPEMRDILALIGHEYESYVYHDYSDFNDNSDYPDTVIDITISQPKIAMMLSLTFGHLTIK